MKAVLKVISSRSNTEQCCNWPASEISDYVTRPVDQ